MMEITATMPHTIIKVSRQQTREQEDELAVEEPLQIQLQLNSVSGRINKNIAVTMRTPGHDKEVAAGFLFTEGIINSREQVSHIVYVNNEENRIMVALKEEVIPLLHNTQRNFYTTSSCGVCGKASIDAIKTNPSFNKDVKKISVAAGTFYLLQDVLRRQQSMFESTGGLHAAALFNSNGEFILLREDVGRHNALDKLIGNAVLNDQLPLPDKILLLSGRASFELVQKAAMAGIKMIAAVGAPSSLAVELAQEYDITLIGFLRPEKFNIYCGAHRINLYR
jgi:FdhD protein